MSRQWKTEELTLINAIKKFPAVYTTARSKCHKEAWAVIGVECGMPPERCRRKWRTIRTGYYMRTRAVEKFGVVGKSKFTDGTLDFITFKRRKSRKIENVNINMQDITEPGEITPEAVSLSSDDDSQDPVAIGSEDVVQAKSTFSHQKTSFQTGADHSKPTPASSSTTILTQDIIQFLLKSKSEESHKEADDLFESIASIMPTNPIRPSPVIPQINQRPQITPPKTYSIQQEGLFPTIQVPLLVDPLPTKVKQEPNEVEIEIGPQNGEDYDSSVFVKQEPDVESEEGAYGVQEDPLNTSSQPFIVKQEFDIKTEDGNESDTFVVTFQNLNNDDEQNVVP